MIPLEANAIYEHVDSDGTKYGFRYLTMRNRQKFYDLINKRKSLTEKIEDEEISDKVAEELLNASLELIDMFLVSINGKEYQKPSEEFFIDQPIICIQEMVSIIFEIVQILQGVKVDLKNSLRQHTSLLNQTPNIINANDVIESQEKEEVA